MSDEETMRDLKRSLVGRPKRPIAQTAIGIGLTSNGVAQLVVSCFYFILAAGIDSNDEATKKVTRNYGIIYGATGIAEIIPGILMITAAKVKWHKFNRWQEEQQSISKYPSIAISLCFNL